MPSLESMVLGRPTSRYETFPQKNETWAEGSPDIFLVARPRSRPPTLGAGPSAPEGSRGVPEASDRPRGPEASRWQKHTYVRTEGARRESLLEEGRTSVCAARLPEGNPFWAQGKGPKLKSAVALFKLLYLIN